MYYATFRADGTRITSYLVGYNTNIPIDAVQISDEDQGKYITGLYYRQADGTPALIPPYVPTADEIKQQKLDALDSEYNPKFDALTLAWATAYMSGDTTTASARKADKDALIIEYNTKKGEIENG